MDSNKNFFLFIQTVYQKSI
uniref:Uncharacterized protein n=1 Tax=Arundo donax TaxID=35708 RepID=A0A0A9BLR4_ARUDO